MSRKLELGVLLLLTISVFASCTSHTEDDIEHHQLSRDHWSYHGENSPEHWVEIERNSQCGGKSQSPINIIDVHTQKPENANSLQLFYSEKTRLRDVKNNGHTIQFDFMRGDSIIYNGKSYELVQVHFHEHAEHLVCGVVYPIEIHLVHLSTDHQISVLAILGKEGGESQIFELLESFLPIEMGESKDLDVTCNLNQLLPAEKTFYSYNGSLTTPPCTEGVNWIVFKEPIILSLEEVQKLKSNMPLDNFRGEQPLNGRLVYLNE